MNHEEYLKASNYWINKDKDSKKMDQETLLKEIESYIKSNNTCVLGTGYDSWIRCTPIEYSFIDKCFYMFSEGGRKFVGLEKNKNVSLAIYDTYDGFGKLKGMQISGVAEIVDLFSDEYNNVATIKKIPLEALKNLKDKMNLIKVTPTKIEFLNSDFKKKGFASRQMVDLSK